MARRVLLFVVLGFIAVFVLAAAAGLYIFHRTSGTWFDSNGVRIFYSDRGKGEPVILIHGFAIQADLQWRLTGIEKVLLPKFRVIALDLRGHGRSGKPHAPDQYGKQMVEDVARLMDHLKIPKAHVVGYSLGGFITLKLAATHPDRLLSASVLGAGWERADNSSFFKATEALAQQLENGHGIEPPSTVIGEGRDKPGIFHRVFVRLMTRYMNDRVALAAILRGARALALSEEEVRAIKIPLLSMAGTKDPLRVGAENLHTMLPEAEVILLDGATHLTAISRKEFRTGLLEFIEKNAQR